MRGRSAIVLVAICAVIVAYLVDRQGSPFRVGQGPGVTSTATSGPSGFDSVFPDLVLVDSTLGEQEQEAAGTGVVIGSSGEVLTNNHVIEGATVVRATDVGNGHTYTATVAGYDRSHDVALLRLEGAQGLATAPLDTSGQLSVGQQVAAVGNAGGTGSLTTAPGTISALNQSITASDQSSGSSEQLTGLIQVNANVRPGDSGGPLVDSSGKVVGIVTAAGSAYEFRGGASTTAGFAIPIAAALSIGKQIASGQASSTVHIGATAQLGVEVGSTSAADGAAVLGVLPGEPAQAAGIATGDVITSFGGSAVDSPNTLVMLIDRDHPGQAVVVGWTDGFGQNRSATVTLGTGPAG